MAGFSIDTALKSGFGLAKREWGAVFAWGAVATLLAVATQLISVGGALPEYLRQVGQDPEAAAAIMEQAAEAQALVTFPIILVLSLAVGALLYGAILRAMLRPQERGFCFFRAGRRELWLLLTMVALGALAMLAIAIVCMAVFSLINMLKAAMGGVLLWALLLGLPALAGMLYLAARFSLAWIHAWDEARFVLLGSWRLTRGQGWRIVLMMLALVFLVLIILAVITIPLVIVSGIIYGVAAMAGGPAALIVTILLTLAILAFFSAFYGVLYAVMAAPYVEVYRALKGVSGSEAAEVFA